MKTHAIARSLFQALLLAAGAPSLAIAADMDSWPNPGFEQCERSPTGWSRAVRAGNTLSRWCAEGARQGTNGIVAELDGQCVTWLKRRFAPRQGVLYRTSVWYRTRSEKQGRKIVNLYLRTPGYFSAAAGFPTATDWTQAGMVFKGDEEPVLIDCVLSGIDGLRAKREKIDGVPVIKNALPVTIFVDDFETRPVTDAEYEGELIPNGGFENGRPGELASSFIQYHSAAPNTYDDQEAAKGKQSMRVKLDKGVWSIATPSFPLKSDTIYKFTCRLKSDRASAGFLFRLWKRDGSFFSKQVRAHAVWGSKAIWFETPDLRAYDGTPSVPFVGQLELRGKVKEPTTLWFDDVSLKVMEF